ncbi:hypothetical protein K6T44_03745 [Riemerella anatipestifer]|uniref:O-antigen ligase family protein n=1 Tax=Riemerella anatipestifer TaxID=34085 RepID=UPI00161558F1|nr:O-antigen ligase family protein [Riemerella anatipestifer]MCQ4156849.1 hypothetical protein [Riemerella anatipestifer]MCT6744214.1 hypothetical protein [Riemerella anatipestifer]MCU7579678.1 hypothetical protein [Riemerella anatipestifer]MDR7846701.1 hypothetical protein [Riemerella anatipestifer]MDY3381697.1 hypothetical protein [Riemerella anatipestifer]
MVFPINLVQSEVSMLALPISLVLTIPSVLYFIISKNEEKKFLSLAIIFSLLAIIYVTLSSGGASYKPFLSAMFFFLPITFYYFVLKIVNNRAVFEKSLTYLSYNIIIFTIIFFFSIFFEFSGIIRTEGTLNGTIFGMRLVGSYGVHTLGSQMFIMIFILIFTINKNLLSKKIKLLSLLCILILTYIIIMSLSRELVLGLIILYAFISLKKYGVLKTILMFLFLSLLISLFLSDLISIILLNWETKITTSRTSDLNELSSGRLDLQFLALQQIMNNPFFATGFHGYTLDFRSYKGYDDLEGWSTHVYFLTALWKMGMVAFFFFSLFFYKIVIAIKKTVILNREEKTLYYIFIVAFFVVNLFWDALLASNVMMLFLFIVGMYKFDILKK